MFKQLFCSHDYSLVNQFIIDSEFDVVVKAGAEPAPHRSLIRTYISDYKCIWCGKLKRLREKTRS